MPSSSHSVIQGCFADEVPRTVAPSIQFIKSDQVVFRQAAGRALPPATRQNMERIFGASFASVRIHLGTAASSIGALAFTFGEDIYFAPGRYDPDTRDGRRLLAHELTHVMQQRSGRAGNPSASHVAVLRDPVLETEAERMGVMALEYQPSARAKAWPQRSTPTAKALSCRNVIQKRVGFEFQTNWKIVPDRASYTGYLTGRAVNTPLFKSKSLIQGVGWQLTSDGGEAEFVTEPIQETDYARLHTIFASMIGFINNLKATHVMMVPMPLSRQPGVTLTGQLAAIEPSANGQVEAVPQMTAGIRLNRLRVAMESVGRLAQDPNSHFNYDLAHADVLAQCAAATTRRRINASAEYRSVVALVAGYVALSGAYQQNGITSEGVKKITTIMSRSNLGAVFRLSPEYHNLRGDRNAITQLKTRMLGQVINIAQGVNLLGAAEINADMRMIPPVHERWLTRSTGPTVQAFVQGLVDGTDLLRWAWLSAPKRWLAGGASMGNMGTETVGPRGHRGPGIIVEFRNFPTGLDSSQWSIWAESLMRWVVEVNTPTIQNPAFTWQANQVLPVAPAMPASTRISPSAVAATGALAVSLAYGLFSGYLSRAIGY